MPDKFAPIQSDALTGLRVVANLSIVFCHAIICRAFAVGAPRWYNIVGTSKLAALLTGFPAVVGMDIFLTLTSFLAAGPLIKQLQTTDKPAQVIWEYYARRLRRIVPAFYTLLLLHSAVYAWESTGKRNLDPEAHEFAINFYRDFDALRWLPTEFLFLSNVLPDWKLVGWTWTLKVQMAFYLAFPWCLVALKPKKLGFRSRLGRAAVLFGLAGVAWRALTIPLLDIQVPFHNLALGNAGKSAVHTPAVVNNFELFMRWFWCSFIGRGIDLAIGVLLYLWVSKTGAQKQARQHPLKYQMAAIIAAAFCLLPSLFLPGATSPEFDPPSPVWTRILGFVVPISIIAPAIVCSITLYLLLQPDRLSSALAIFLSSWPVKAMADRSYSIYLFHFQCTHFLIKFTPVRKIFGEPDSYAALLLFPVLVYCASFVFALAVDSILDRVVGQASQRQMNCSQCSARVCFLLVPGSLVYGLLWQPRQAHLTRKAQALLGFRVAPQRL